MHWMWHLVNPCRSLYRTKSDNKQIRSNPRKNIPPPPTSSDGPENEKKTNHHLTQPSDWYTGRSSVRDSFVEFRGVGVEGGRHNGIMAQAAAGPTTRFSHDPDAQGVGKCAARITHTTHPLTRHLCPSAGGPVQRPRPAAPKHPSTSAVPCRDFFVPFFFFPFFLFRTLPVSQEIKQLVNYRGFF